MVNNLNLFYKNQIFSSISVILFVHKCVSKNLAIYCHFPEKRTRWPSLQYNIFFHWPPWVLHIHKLGRLLGRGIDFRLLWINGGETIWTKGIGLIGFWFDIGEMWCFRKTMLLLLLLVIVYAIAWLPINAYNVLNVLDLIQFSQFK